MTWREQFTDWKPVVVDPEEVRTQELSEKELVFAASALGYVSSRTTAKLIVLGHNHGERLMFAASKRGGDPYLFAVDDRGGIRAIAATDIERCYDRIIPMIPAAPLPVECGTCAKKFQAGDYNFAILRPDSPVRAYCPAHVRRSFRTKPGALALAFFLTDDMDEADPVVTRRIADNVVGACFLMRSLIKEGNRMKIYVKSESPLDHWAETVCSSLEFTRERILKYST